VARRQRILLVGAALAALAWLVIFSSGDTPDPVGPGSRAPSLGGARLLDGAELPVSALEGRVLLVNFWATWCKPCEEEMPAMQRLYQTLAGERFELLAISVDETAAPVQEFRDRLGLRFPILLDPERKAARAFQTFKFPESYLIDAEGVVVSRFIGPKEWDAPAYVDRIRRVLYPAAQPRGER
jgi:thiol-disulfide isomerase/thioredoxin